LFQCDIVGTGGDSHSTFNISTTASIIASPLLMMAKHGNRAQTSFSGSADVLNAIAPVPPKISAVTAENLAQVYEATSYAFLFAPNFHPGMMYANPVRRGLGLRTIFNLMGPLANPVDWALEARVVGVAYQSLGPVFAEALRSSGVKKALVVCGAEDLDEISCAGPTNCWKLTGYPNPDYDGPDEECSCDEDEDIPRTLVKIETFQLHPSDFGLPAHPLSAVYGRKMPKENAAKIMSILRNELPPDDPILTFVLINVAALLVISGLCEADTSNMGPGDDGKAITERGPGGGRWKEGVRRARWAVESGSALKCLEQFIEVTNRL
jgi:anthranilate phosphoribosyltransferase